MRGLVVRTACVCLVVAVAASAFLWLARPHGRGRAARGRQEVTESTRSQPQEPDLPPPGLPILASRPRDWFPVIREPHYLSVTEAAGIIDDREPVLGLVLGGQVRAYSTNQLNRHEMVLDEIAGTPVLVTY
jgi:hypothetical protein